ncbi:hypothetical protein K9N68_07540 [Kovacikia minuta CCNUW1]|uniref:hypothetical protein n=1 Tax=Kovacikia minuta TaxID=2931930 RepID=UPI001CCE22F0|nr:hypothetical protein [Kovacikia minuta]UBF27757.1 hypothetical protein K9N68_07540 [Kovacikia minuta CCNUW1]
MAHALFWLPLLALFTWLAWSGWNEYQKVEAYRIWAEQFEQAKYDIFSVLGQKDDRLTWGIPTRKGPIGLKTFSLKEIQSIRLLINGKPMDASETLSAKGKAALEFVYPDQSETVQIPFTELSLAAKWEQYLQQKLQAWQSSV